jgi:hypothetical protein
MALIGTIIVEGQSVPEGPFLIGCGERTYRVPKTGYLVVFANDSFSGYTDNKGILKLSIQRIL